MVLTSPDKHQPVRHYYQRQSRSDAFANPNDVPSYQLPKNTPFYLKGSGSDDDGDEIYYAWEQFDEDGPGSPTKAQMGLRLDPKDHPLFKNFHLLPPMKDISRCGYSSCRQWSDPFQALPTTNRDINIAFSVRDNKTTGGGISYEEMLIQVQNSGPLSVTYPNTQ